MMETNNLIIKMEETGVVPVIKLEDTTKALDLARALSDGGINCAEITFRAAGADKVIADISKNFPDMLVGAGTVTTTEQVDRAVAAGASFCVAPGLNPVIVKHCLDKGVPFIPGVSTCSEIEQAIGLGLPVVKFFPAEQAGGIAYIKAVSAPYSGIKFMPTGGINENNIMDYLSFDRVFCCGGSWMVPAELINASDWGMITSLSRAATGKILGFELAHIGINTENEKAAAGVAALFGSVFGFDVKAGNSSIFVSQGIEIMKNKGLGKNGHIAIRTNSIIRAIANLRAKGIETDMETAKYDDKKKLAAVYLKQDFGGFAVHLLQKK